MAEVHINSRDGKKHRDDVDFALRELKKQIKKSGLMQELRRRESYTPPSKARRVKRNESAKLRKREEKKAQRGKSRIEF